MARTVLMKIQRLVSRDYSGSRLLVEMGDQIPYPVRRGQPSHAATYKESLLVLSQADLGGVTYLFLGSGRSQ